MTDPVELAYTDLLGAAERLVEAVRKVSGAQLAIERQLTGLTQSELAHLWGVSRPYVTKVERARTVSADTKLAYRAALAKGKA